MKMLPKDKVVINKGLLPYDKNEQQYEFDETNISIVNFLSKPQSFNF